MLKKIKFVLSVLKKVYTDPSFMDGPITFSGDGFLTTRPFGEFDEKFKKYFEMTFDPPVDPSLRRFEYTIWRSHLYSWAMSAAKNLDGDMVELGVWWGMFSFTGINYIDMAGSGKKFHLIDAFGTFNHEPIDSRFNINSRKYEADIYDDVMKKFSGMPVVFHRGYVPEVLFKDEAKLPEKICFLSMDLNNVHAEKEGIEFLWDRIVPGGLIYIDDYGHQNYESTRSMYDDFFDKKGLKILKTPFSSALVIKN